MSIDETNRYETDVAHLFEVMMDEAFLREKYAALGHDDFSVLEHTVSGDQVTLRTRRIVPANVPTFAKRFISPRSTIAQTENWKGLPATPHGTWSIEVEGPPISVSGTMSLEAVGESSQHVIHGEVTVKIPLVGGKIAKFVAGDSAKGIAEEAAFMRQYLAKA